MHNRQIRAQSFERADGLWEIDAELLYTKAYDFNRRSGAVHRAGQPFHHLHLRITFDDDFVIHQAVAVFDSAPFGEYCSAIEPDYEALVGMSLIKGFRQSVKARFARTAGCSHMSELAGVLPTVAMQTMASRRKAATGVDESTQRPFQLEGCHSLRLDGPVVKEFHPQWYRAPNTARADSNEATEATEATIISKPSRTAKSHGEDAGSIDRFADKNVKNAVSN